MRNKYSGCKLRSWRIPIKIGWSNMGTAILLTSFVMSSALAKELTIKSLDFSALPGSKLQLQLTMSGKAVLPKEFSTDNPARIALDFSGVKSSLHSKVFPVNMGIADSVYAMEAKDRTRVVINLLKMAPHTTRVEGNKVFITLNNSSNSVASALAPGVAVGAVTTETAPVKVQEIKKPADVRRLLPEQTISDIDFRRGSNGEGRLLISLTSPNTVVDTKEKGGKVHLTFINTKIPQSLAKRLDVSDFATPVNLIDSSRQGSKTKITVSMRNGNYGYSSFQSDGLLTVEFRPLTPSEKEELKRKKFPYSGERLSLNFQNIEVRSVLQILADFTDLNIVASDSVGGSVTLRLNDVPWDQSLDLILKSKGLAKRQTGNVVLVAPVAEINKIEKDELEAQKVVELLEPLRTEYIQINYAKAENFRSLLLGGTSPGSLNGCSVTNASGGSGGGGGGGNVRGSLNGRGNSANGNGGRGRVDDRFTLTSNRGTVIVDSRTNTLIVRDMAKNLEEIRKLLNLLDKPVRQVLIEARIVTASEDFARELGVNLGSRKQADVGGEKTSVIDGLVDLAAATPHGALGMTLLRAGDYLLNLEISALQDEGRGEVLSNPRVLTSDRCPATISQGVQIPYKTTSQNGTQTQLIDATLELSVTPQITPNGSVIMDLNIQKDNPSAVSNDGAIGIDTREISTSVRINDGETVVLGGVFEGNDSQTINRVPFFSDLPGIGHLFRRTNNSRNKKELLIFVTPKIVKDNLSVR